MATSYAPALNGLAIPMPDHHHGSNSSQKSSSRRKAAPDRLPTITSTSASPIEEKPTLDLNGSAHAHAHNHTHSAPLNSQTQTQARRGHQYSQSYAPPTPSIYDGFHTANQTPDTMEFPAAPIEMHDGPGPYEKTGLLGHSGHIHEQDVATSSDSKYLSSTELLAAILIPLPFVLTSLVLNARYIPSYKIDPAIEKLDTMTGGEADLLGQRSLVPYLSFFSICMLTSATLLLVGLIGEIAGFTSAEEEKTQRRKSTQEIVSGSTVQRIVGRVLSVGLPFFAASQLGGERVAITVLVTVAADMMATTAKAEEVTRVGGIKVWVLQKKWTLGSLLLQAMADTLKITSHAGPRQSMFGYLALGCSMFLLPLPYPTDRPTLSFATSPVLSKAPDGVFKAPWDARAGLPSTGATGYKAPLTSTPWDTDLTLASGVLAGGTGFAVYFLSPADSQTLDKTLVIGGLFTTLAFALSLLLANPKSLRSTKRYGVVAGLLFSIAFKELLEAHSFLSLSSQLVLVGLSWIGMQSDSHMARIRSGSIQRTRHQHHHHHDHEHDHASHSKISGYLLETFQDWPLVHSILIEKDSRRILYFMLLNLGFMLVQTFYAIVTGSLGLLSDSVHMFFDCIALVVGLAAAVMSKWPPSIRFPYGYGKMDTLAGFANGVFLMLISVEIIYEAIERLAEGVQLQRITELLIVSGLGLAVNLVGMMAFGHAHHHHGHDHGHDHGHGHSHDDHSHSHNHDHSHAHDHAHDHNHNHNHNHSQCQTDGSLHTSPLSATVPSTPSKPPAHSHSHGHSHGNENMIGIWLHVLADTLGSAAVVVSTLLIQYTGWTGFDPLASCLIAILIFGSAVPLVTSSAKRLLLTVPESTEFDLKEAISGVAGLRGVAGVTAPRFWVPEGDNHKVEGVMHVIVNRGADLDDARQRAMDYLHARGMNVLVQVEREGEGRCWCGGGAKSP